MRVVGVLLLLAVCIAHTAGLAVMSVDVGSEFMKVAVVKPGVPMEIVLNTESRRKTPVAVALRNGERTFGDPALQAGAKSPKQAYWYFLDLLGKKMDNPQVALYRQRFPYYDMEADPDTGMVLFKYDDETSYSVEELTAMLLEYAKLIAEAFAEQPISETVITVPVFFNQAERRAMQRAGELAGLKVLQLINDNTAVALNYGVFRRKAFNGTAVHYMFFDMGAQSTTATIASYQVAKTKSPTTGIEDKFPQVTISGVGFNRNLGGLEFQLRLREHLAQLFNRMQKTDGDVKDNQRSMQKLFKEAGRLKQILSANNEHFAQVESLLDDVDFRAKVTRDEYETMCEDLFDEVAKVVKDALKTSEVTMEEMTEVILMGAGTRVPRVQAAIRKAVGREELGKGINTDEAAALGGSYQAAHLSKGYKVKKFNIKDANMYPIQVEFERVRTNDDTVEASKMVKRTLFGRMNPFPQKKVMTFNKHTKDFGFNVNYGELGFLSEKDVEIFGSQHLQEVSLHGIDDAQVKYQDSIAESKGIKAHFKMDDSGILTLDRVESLFEKPAEVEETKDEESTLSKIGSTISNLFGGGDEKEEKEGAVEDPKEEAKDSKETKDSDKTEEKKADKTEENKADKTEEKAKEDDKKSKKTDKKDGNTTEEQKEEKTDKPDDEKKEEDTKSEEKSTDEKKDEKDGEKKEETKEEKKRTKPVTIKEEIKSTASVVDMIDPNEDKIKASKKKLSDLKKKDEEKHKLEKVRNELEGFIFDTSDKIYQDMYKKASTDEERETIGTKMSEASDWLYEQDETTERKAYEDKLKEVKKLTRDLFERVKEHEERPRALEALNSILNYSQVFMEGMKNYTGEDLPFTEVEMSTLGKLINTTKEWNVTASKEQAATPLSQKPIMTIMDIATKINDLDREVKYLVNKAKTFRPKPKKAENKTEEATKKKTTNKTKDSDIPSDSTEVPEGIKIDLPPIPDEDAQTETPEETTSPEDKETLQLEDQDADSSESSQTEETDKDKTQGHMPGDEL